MPIDYTKLSIIDNRAISDDRLSDTASMVLIAMQAHQQQSGVNNISKQDVVAMRPQLTDYGYRKAIGQLEKFGYIKRSQKNINGCFGEISIELVLPEDGE